MNRIVGEDNVLGSLIDNCYFVPIQGEVDSNILDKICKEVVEVVYDSEVLGVIFDFSNIAMIDSYIFNGFNKVTKMVELMGAKVVWIGLKAGIVSVLADLNVDIKGINIAVNIKDGLGIIQCSR